MAIFTVDEHGVTAPSLETALADIRSQFGDLFGEDLAGEAQTPQGQLAGVIAVLEAIIGESLVEVGNINDPQSVTGAQQDRTYGLLDVIRRRATRSTVRATVTGVAGTGLPAGSRAKTMAGDEFRTIADATVAPQPGVTVEMEAVETGPVPAAIGALTEIITIVPGWETITNAEAAIQGIDRQSDSDYRGTYKQRTARGSAGPMSALESAVEEVLATKYWVSENFTGATAVTQLFSVYGHHVLIIARSGNDAALQRTIETHRGMGVGTMTAQRGGTPNNTNLDAVSNGTVTWNGTAYTGLDLRPANTGEAKAAALTALLAADQIPPVIAYVDDAYVAQYSWHPLERPAFGTAAVETDFALRPADVTASPGPFIRTRDRALTITVAVTRQAGFPADGTNDMRRAITAVVDAYDIGQQVWANDILRAAEGVNGTRVTAITVQYNTVDVSGISPPLDSIWTLPGANLAVTLT